MKQSLVSAWMVLALVVLLTGLSVAQDDTTRYVFGTYLSCDQGREAWSDTLTETFIAPIIDKHVSEGHLTGWGRMAHNVGGHWRRLQYLASNDLNTLLDTRNAIIESMQSEATAAGREIGSICPGHDDYIWRSVASSQALEDQLASSPPATYSTYFICDPAREDRVDEVVREAYAPVLNKMVEDGKLNGWTWFAHVAGGKHRRLLTYSGADHKALIAAVEEYGSVIQESHPEMSQEFSSICNSHDDYLWDVVISKP